MPFPMAGGVLQEEVVASQPLTASDMEEEVPSKEVAEKVEQAPEVVKGTKFVQASIALVAQDLGATQTFGLEDPTSRKTPDLARIVIAKQATRPVVAKEYVGATTSFTRIGMTYLVPHSLLNSCASILFISLLLFFFLRHYLSPPRLTQPLDHPLD